MAPKVLVLGGVGFIGRSLVQYLVENSLCEKIRVADKALPQMSRLTPDQTKAFESVEFVQANLARDASVTKAFTMEGGEFDYVINCAAMTKFGQDESIYTENIFDVSIKSAKEAAKRGVKRFIELSTSQVYDAGKKPSSEDDKLKPWTDLAACKLKVETELATIDGLNYVIVRPATVYGVSDMLGLMPRLVVGAVYKKLQETMKLLWTEKLRINTVHVRDVAKALWHLCENGDDKAIYNLADKADSTQGSITNMIAEIFDIKAGYVGSVMSNLAKVAMASTTESVNEKHMQPWAEMCADGGVSNTSLSPYLDQELLYNNSLAVDGSKIEGTGFTYDVPAPTTELLMESVQAYIDLNQFPKF